MLGTFFKFEIKSWLRAPMPWIFMAVFGLLTFFATVTDNVSIGGSFGNIWKNAPFVLQNWYATWSVIGVLLIAAFVNSAGLRDFETRSSQIVFSKPISKAAWYFGHFWGAVAVAMVPMLGVLLGVSIGLALNSVFDFVPPERFGPFSLAGHLNGFLVFVIPNTIFAGGILYAIAVNTRSTTYAFIGAIALLVGAILAGETMRDLEKEWIAAMLDPFGGKPFEIATKYWTVDDKNARTLGLEGMMLLNRLFWMVVGLLVLFWGYLRFDFSEKKSGSKKTKMAPEKEDGDWLKDLGGIPKVAPQTGRSTMLAQLWNQYKTEVKWVVRSIAFLILAGLGLLNFVPNAISANNTYGAHELPVTYKMVEVIRGSFYLYTIAIMIYFAGALVWKERNSKVNEIYDTMPTQNWTAWLAKFGAVITLMMLLQTIAMLAGIAAQALMGFSRFDVWVYVRELLVMDTLFFAFVLALSMLVHALSPNMYLGFAIVIALLLFNTFGLPALHVAGNMFRFGRTPDYTLSDFYGYQPYARILTWFNGYWLLFSSLLALAAILLWPRGSESGWRARFKNARLDWPRYRTFGMGAGAAFLGVGAWMFYNTHIVNKILNDKEEELLQVRYEKEYKRLSATPQPRVYDVKYDIQIFPEARKLVINGKYWARNRNNRPVDSLLVLMPSHGEFELRNERLSLLKEEKDLELRIYKVNPALAPGDSMLLDFTTNFAPKGIENELEFSRLVQNGTFFDNIAVTPVLGYQENNELTDKNKRKKYGLPEKSRKAALNPSDSLARRNQYLSNYADWVNVETVISTSPDQIAIAPGSLLREWTEGGRRFFHYKLDHKSWNFYSFMSADYEVARREHKGVKLEVYHHKEHTHNVERMLDAMAASLDYFTQNFGPYYHKQCRIIEFPRFSAFAQAFPGTMPYSEGIGFIQDFRPEEEDIDLVTYVTAHEIGHQWWAHQECGADMQGSESTTEMLAQYSALMVSEQRYGRDVMRRFLSYEMDRYLRGRSTERLREMPLSKCENQDYIHYRKGSVVMYYLREMIGEAQVNAALRSFLEKFRYKDAPYPTSLDLIGAFYEHTPDSLDYVVRDLFEDITLFENRTTELSSKELPGGKFEVTVKVECRKIKSDELGKETEVPINDYIEIGAFAKPAPDKKYGKTLHRQRVKITQRDNTFTFVVDEKPDKAGIDPFSMLIDRNPEDNLKEL